MAKSTQIANGIANDQAEIVADALDGGFLRIYSGTKPANADTAITDQVLLVELEFSSPSDSDITDGLITFDSFAPALVDATGTATWFRAVEVDGSTAVFDGSIAATGGDANLLLPTTSLVAGLAFAITAFTHQVHKAATGY